MKSFRVHVVWSAVAVVLAAALAEFISARRDESRRETEMALRRQVSDLKEKVAELEGERVEPRAPSAAPTLVKLPGEALPEAAPAPKDRKKDQVPLTVEQIRALLRGGTRDDLWKALAGIGDLQDRAQKLELLKEILPLADDKMREKILSMLRGVGGQEAVDLAVTILQASASASVRTRAVAVLGDLGVPAAMVALQQSMQDESPWVRTYAARSLAKLGQPAAQAQWIVSLGKMLEDPDGAAREDAAQMLGRLETTATFPYLTRALSDSNSNVRRESVDSLKDSGLAEAIPILELALKDSNPLVVRDAQRAIDEIKKALAKPPAK
jgi:HEAT repeat protein